MVARGLEPAPERLAQAQGDVWGAVRELSYDLGAHSRTGALDEVQRSRGTDIDRMAGEFSVVEGQVGLLVLYGTMPLGMDVVGSLAHYRSLHSRLLRGYLMDALSSRSRREGARDGGSRASGEGSVNRAGGSRQAGEIHPAERGQDPDQPGAGPGDRAGDEATAPLAAAESFLAVVRDAERVTAPTVGLGEYSVLSSGATGAELVHEGRMVHLSAFPEEDMERREDARSWATSGLPFITRRTGPRRPGRERGTR